MLIYMRFDMSICVFDMFMSLVCPISVPAALQRPQKKHAPVILEQVSCVFCRLLSLLAWCVQSACLRRFADLSKNTPLEFWTMCLMYFVIFCVFLAWCAQSACLRRFADLRKNTTLEFWTMCPMDFFIFCVFLAWCAQSACLRRFADLRKNTPLDFWTMYPM